MNGQVILQSLWLVAPVIAAGLIHIAVIRTRVLPALARVPLDLGRTFRGRRIFGDNKSLRGAVVMPVATIACTLLQAALADRFDWARELRFVDFRSVSPVLWGALLGVGYIAGELPNSFLKRQRGVAPGAIAPGGEGVFFWVMDQVDSLAGILVCLCIVWVPPWEVVLALVGLTLVIHPATSLLMRSLKLKSRIG